MIVKRVRKSSVESLLNCSEGPSKRYYNSEQRTFSRGLIFFFFFRIVKIPTVRERKREDDFHYQRNVRWFLPGPNVWVKSTGNESESRYNRKPSFGVLLSVGQRIRILVI